MIKGLEKSKQENAEMIHGLEESLKETEQYLRKVEKELASLRSIWVWKLASKFTGGQTKRKKN